MFILLWSTFFHQNLPFPLNSSLYDNAQWLRTIECFGLIGFYDGYIRELVQDFFKKFHPKISQCTGKELSGVPIQVCRQRPASLVSLASLASLPSEVAWPGSCLYSCETIFDCRSKFFVCLRKQLEIDNCKSLCLTVVCCSYLLFLGLGCSKRRVYFQVYLSVCKSACKHYKMVGFIWEYLNTATIVLVKHMWGCDMFDMRIKPMIEEHLHVCMICR